MPKYTKVPVEFEAWKKGVIEAWRVFLPAFFVVVYAQFEAGVKLNEWKNWLLPLATAAVLAGAKAVLKWAREKWGNKEYDTNWLYKLPL